MPEEITGRTPRRLHHHRAPATEGRRAHPNSISLDTKYQKKYNITIFLKFKVKQ